MGEVVAFPLSLVVGITVLCAPSHMGFFLLWPHVHHK